MGRVRLDIIDDKMGIHVKLAEALGALDNGSFVEVGDLIDNDDYRDLYETKALTASPTQIAMIADDGHIYDEHDDGYDIVVEKGAIVRAYLLHINQVVTVDVARLDGTGFKKGDKLVPVAGGVKLGKVATSSATDETATPVAVVQALEEDMEGNELVVIKFL